MPYIKQENRTKYIDLIEKLSQNIEDEGELNYVISKLCHLIVDRKGESYKNLAFCVSALENAKLEFYRKRVAPYEDKKEIENGKV